MSAEEDFVDPEWLLAVVGTLVPAQAGGMPAASDLEEFREVPPGEAKWIYGPLVALLEAREAEKGESFLAAEPARREAILREIESGHPGLIEGVMMQTAIRYYRSETVARALGLEARAPFPGGYQVEETDWSLLDPVREMKPIYRELPAEGEES